MIRRSFDNELFPSSDWRCLLPPSSPDRVVVAVGTGWAPSTAARMWPDCRSVMGPEVTDDDRFDGVADLVVGDSFSRSSLEAVGRLLRNDGIAYIESDLPRMISPRHVIRRMSNAGFVVGPVYSMAIGSHRWAVSWWIPVGSVKAVRFVADAVQQHRSSTPRLRTLLEQAPVALAQRWPRLVAGHPWLLYPPRRQRLGAVMARAGSGWDPTDLRPGLQPDGGEPASDVVMRIGGSSTDQPMLFYFGRSEAPTAVVKAPTRSEEVEASRHEAEVLSRLAAQPSPMEGVPKPVPVTRVQGVDAWGQTYAPGVDMARLASPPLLEAHAGAVSDWVVALADRTAKAMHPRIASGLRQSVEQAALGLSDLPDGDELARAVLDSFDRLNLDKSVCEHGDLGPWNIQLDAQGRLTVIDWADSVEAGLPARDLVHFIAHLCLCAHDAHNPERRPDVIAQLMDADHPCGRLMADHTAAYAEKLGLPAGNLDDFRVVTWALDLLDRPSYGWTTDLYLELLRAEVQRRTSSP